MLNWLRTHLGKSEAESPPPPAEPSPPEALETLEHLEPLILEALRSVHDPEIPVNIHDLGLIYGLDISPQGAVHIRMTLTAPACPVAGTLPKAVERAVAGVPGVTDAQVQLVWDPPWHPGLMSEAARLQLGLL